ncbi:cysteine desulfurase [Candidatus Sumerlaeota bacterium]|nr:cysteine desulfurase [Candidatus Sumerlaeota bacterium]
MSFAKHTDLPPGLTPHALYFDNAATTPLAPEALGVMMPFLSDRFGNPSAIYSQGIDARYAVEKARRRVARAIGAREGEIIFTASGSESDNLAIKGTFLARRHRGMHVISCTTEHSAVLNTLEALSDFGAEVTLIDVGESGVIDPDDVARAIRDDTVLITVMFANSETGVIHPIAEIARVARERGVVFHCDAVQSVGKEPIDVETLGVDLLSLSGHKIHGPKGGAALYVRRGVEIQPIIHGGNQEGGLRAGTENVPAIAGLGAALELAEALRPAEMPRLRALGDWIIERLQRSINGVQLCGDPAHRLATILCLTIEGIEGARLVSLAGEEGISIAAGSACSAGGLAPSHVLTAMGLPMGRVSGGIRISLGRENTDAAVDHLIAKLPLLVRALREGTPRDGR